MAVLTVAKALVIIPLPCDGHFFCQLINAAAQAWEADRPGQTLTTAHLETREDGDGKTVVVWDEPVAATAPNPGGGL